MYSIIIADDEAIECQGQEKILQDSFSNVKLLPSAGSGAELIQAVREYKPDIIITDINMPGLNGLKAIEVLRKESVNSKVIINTAYSEFEYAREAITLGASDFLVKPLDRESYVRAVEKAMKKIDQERSREQRAMAEGDSFQRMVDIAGREVISSVILGKPNEEDLYLWLDNMGHAYWGGVFVAARPADVTRLQELELEADRFMRQACTSLMKLHRDMLILFLFPGELVERGNYKSWVSSLLSRFSQKLEKVCDLSVRYGVSCWRYDYDEMAVSYQEAVTALQAQDQGQICFFETEVSAVRVKQNFIRMAGKLTEAVRSNNTELQTKLLREQLQLWHQEGTTKQQAIVLLIEILQNCSRDICGHNIYSWQQLKQTFSLLQKPEELAKSGTESLQVLLRAEGKDQVRAGYVWDALDYIEKNYAKDISLEETAAAAGQGISSFYLSRLLTQQLQTSFVELLTSARINEAIRLMREEGDRTKNLSGRVGYQSAAYFYRVFKKNTGLTVGEMRELLTRLETETGKTTVNEEQK